MYSKIVLVKKVLKVTRNYFIVHSIGHYLFISAHVNIGQNKVRRRESKRSLKNVLKSQIISQDHRSAIGDKNYVQYSIIAIMCSNLYTISYGIHHTSDYSIAV